MADRQIFIDADSIYALMVHYTQGQVPLDGEIREAGVSNILGRWIGLRVRSKWEGEPTADGGIPPLHFRYEGRRVMSWEGGKSEPVWGEPDAVDAPTSS